MGKSCKEDNARTLEPSQPETCTITVNEDISSVFSESHKDLYTSSVITIDDEASRHSEESSITISDTRGDPTDNYSVFNISSDSQSSISFGEPSTIDTDVAQETSDSPLHITELWSTHDAAHIRPQTDVGGGQNKACHSSVRGQSDSLPPHPKQKQKEHQSAELGSSVWRPAFSCPTCGKVFTHKSDVNRHFLSHSDKRDHVCRYCDKAFKRSDHMKVHMRKHESSPKPSLPKRVGKTAKKQKPKATTPASPPKAQLSKISTTGQSTMGVTTDPGMAQTLPSIVLAQPLLASATGLPGVTTGPNMTCPGTLPSVLVGPFSSLVLGTIPSVVLTQPSVASATVLSGVPVVQNMPQTRTVLYTQPSVNSATAQQTNMGATAGPDMSQTRTLPSPACTRPSETSATGLPENVIELD